MFAGRRSFGGQSLHRIGDTLNPYEQAISIIGKTLAPFDEDNLTPCSGFGDGEFTFFRRLLNVYI
jgi:E3 ubiquitin-protein ligase RGLG